MHSEHGVTDDDTDHLSATLRGPSVTDEDQGAVVFNGFDCTGRAAARRALVPRRFGVFLTLSTVPSELPYSSIMTDTSRQLKGRNDVLSSLNTAIDALNRAKGATSMRSAKVAFTSTNVLLAAIKVSFLRSMSVNHWLMYAGLGNLQDGICSTRAGLR